MNASAAGVVRRSALGRLGPPLPQCRKVSELSRRAARHAQQRCELYAPIQAAKPLERNGLAFAKPCRGAEARGAEPSRRLVIQTETTIFRERSSGRTTPLQFGNAVETFSFGPSHLYANAGEYATKSLTFDILTSHLRPAADTRVKTAGRSR